MRRGGFTLIEILMVTAIMGIASVYMLGSIISSNRTYVVVDQAAESQQGMRAVAQLMLRDIRGAGMMLPRHAALCANDSQAGPDSLYVSDTAAIDPGDDLGSYDGARVQGGATNVNGTGNATTLTVDSLIIEPTPPTRAAYDTDSDGTNDSDFQVGGGAIVIDLDNPGRGAACGTVEVVNLGTPSVTVRTASKALGNLVGSAQLVVVPAHKYGIANGDQIRRDGDLLAEGVEDLQLAYFLDANGDDIIDPGEMHGTGAGVNANFDAQDTDMSDLREVRINLMVRTRGEDRDFAGQPEASENRAAGAADGYRRRVYTNTVRLRNLARALGS